MSSFFSNTSTSTNTDTDTNTDTSTLNELRKFGFIFGPAALLISIWQASKGHWGHVIFFGPAGTYALVMSIFKPRWNYPLRWVLEKAFKGLMWLITHAVLTATFYTVFTPIGWVMRWMGKDLLAQKIDVTAETYWVDCEKKEFSRDHYNKQF